MMPAKSTSDHRTYSSMMYGLAGIASRTVESEREARGRQTPTPAQQWALSARRRARPSVPVRPEPIGTQPAPQRSAADAEASRGLGKLTVRHVEGVEDGLALSRGQRRAVGALREEHDFAELERALLEGAGPATERNEAPAHVAAPRQALPFPPGQTAQLAAQLLQRIRPHRLTLAPDDRKADRSVERGQIPWLQASRLALLEAQPDDADPLLHFVIHRHAITVQVDGRRECLEDTAFRIGHYLVYVEHQARVDKLVPRADPRELGRQSGAHVLRGRLGQPSPRAPPVEAEPLERAPHTYLVGMRRVAGEQGLDQGCPRGVGKLRRKRARERLDVALEQEAEIAHRLDPHQALVPALSLERDRRRAAPRVAPDRALGELRSLDARARHAEAVREVAQRAGDGAPARAHRSAAHTGLPAGGRFLRHNEVAAR